MPIITSPSAGIQVLCEMEEFAEIPPAGQRYIRRSLDVAFQRWDRLGETTRNDAEAEIIEGQIELYSRLDEIRAAIPVDNDEDRAVRFMSLAADLTSFDLAHEKIRSFAAYRFLYERLLGATARPWLLPVFLMCVTLARLCPSLRTELLRSVDEQSAADTHSAAEPRFIPEWVDRLDG